MCYIKLRIIYRIRTFILDKVYSYLLSLLYTFHLIYIFPIFIYFNDPLYLKHTKLSDKTDCLAHEKSKAAKTFSMILLTQIGVLHHSRAWDIMVFAFNPFHRSRRLLTFRREWNVVTLFTVILLYTYTTFFFVFTPCDYDIFRILVI